MGYALAQQAFFMGADVTLISGPTNLKAINGIKLIRVESAEQMLKASMEIAEAADIFIATAAVADYKPKTYCPQKIKKNNTNISIDLVENSDILTSIKKKFPGIFAVGFAAETNNLAEYGKNKLKAKQLDLIAINDVSGGKVFAQDHNELHIFSKDNKNYFLERNTKDNIAQKLLEIIFKSISNDECK